MSNLVQFFRKWASEREGYQQKEKKAILMPAAEPLKKTEEFGTVVNRNIVTPKGIVPSSIATKPAEIARPSAAPSTGKEVVNTPVNNPGVKLQKRATGVYDVDGNEFVNVEDTEVLAKLGYTISKEEYSTLEKTSEVLDLYSYTEKIAGVPKEVARAIDKGEAFSGEYLKDMAFDVPEGYEIKGDLVCPIEKTADISPGSMQLNNDLLNMPTSFPASRKVDWGAAARDVTPSLRSVGANVLSNLAVREGSKNIGSIPAKLQNKAMRGAAIISYMPSELSAQDRPSSDVLGRTIDRVGGLGTAVSAAARNPKMRAVGTILNTGANVLNFGRDLDQSIKERSYGEPLVGTIKQPATAIDLNTPQQTQPGAGSNLVQSPYPSAPPSPAPNSPALFQNSPHRINLPQQPNYLAKQSNEKLQGLLSKKAEDIEKEAERLANKYTGGKMEKEASKNSRRIMEILKKSNPAARAEILKKLQTEHLAEIRPAFGPRTLSQIGKTLGLISTKKINTRERINKAIETIADERDILRKKLEELKKLPDNEKNSRKTDAALRLMNIKQKKHDVLVKKLEAQNKLYHKYLNLHQQQPYDIHDALSKYERDFSWSQADIDDVFKKRQLYDSASYEKNRGLRKALKKEITRMRELDPKADEGLSGKKVREVLIKDVFAKKPLLAQYPIKQEGLKELLFTPHFGETENANRAKRFTSFKADRDIVGLRGGLDELENFETVINRENIADPSKRLAGAKYFIPRKLPSPTTISPENLSSSAEGYMYKGGPASKLQQSKNLGSVAETEGVFLSGEPKVSADYAGGASLVEPAGFKQLREYLTEGYDRSKLKGMTSGYADYFKPQVLGNRSGFGKAAEDMEKTAAAKRDWYSIPAHVREAIVRAKKGGIGAKKDLSDISYAGGKASARKREGDALRKLINKGDELPPKQAFESRYNHPGAVGDFIGTSIFGNNYIPKPMEGEDMVDAFDRLKRQRQTYNLAGQLTSQHPLTQKLGLGGSELAKTFGGLSTLNPALGKSLSPFIGNIPQAAKTWVDMVNNPSIMSQFKR